MVLSFSIKSQKNFLSLIVISFVSLVVSAQDNLITGKVKDTKGEILLGVTIIEKGTSNGVVTDFDGNFSIVMRDRSHLLEFSYVGYETQEVSVAGKNKIDIFLNASSQELDEVIVVGYGTVNKKDVLGAIGSVKAEEITETVPVDVVGSLQGRMAGVEIFQGSYPGESSQVLIRGVSTLSSGGIGPLYVVDGQQQDDIDNLNPADIESIDVLKDGASAAIYGSKSANGVVMITTKKGAAGYVKTSVSNNASLSFLSTKIPVANTTEYLLFEKLRCPNCNFDDPYSLARLYGNDLQEAISQVGFKNQLNVSFRGGSETARFYFSNSILKQEGIVIGSGFERFTSLLKTDFDLNRWFSYGAKINVSYEKRSGYNEGSAFRTVSFRQPNVPIYNNADGSFITEEDAPGRVNPVALIEDSVKDLRVYRANMYNFAKIKLTNELLFKTTLGINYAFVKSNNFNPSTVINSLSSFINGYELNNLRYDIQNENYFNYTKKINRVHSITALLGLSVQKWRSENASIYGTEFNNDAIQTLNNVTRLNGNSTRTLWSAHSLSSVYARATYDYKKKYFVAATFRRDGSSRFGLNNKWGNFPSVSAGWKISKERFMRSLSNVSNLKLRAGYAITGNERIGDFLSSPLYNPGSFYNDAGGFNVTQLGNKNLGWEETAQLNYGIDLAILKNRFSLSIDRYIKTTTDLLYNVNIPSDIGFTRLIQNVGSVENRGLEIVLQGTVLRNKNFKWSSNFNIAFNKTKVLKLANPEGFETGAYLVKEGQPIGNMYGYSRKGIFKYDASNAFTDNGIQLTPVLDEDGPVPDTYTLNGAPYTGNINKLTFAGIELKGGDIIWEDRNNDFKIDADNDRAIIGNGLPDFVGGFRNKFEYQHFSLSILFNYKFGHDIYRYWSEARDKRGAVQVSPSPDAINEAWSAPGDQANYPRLLPNTVQNQLQREDTYVDQGDFIRLQNINFTYKLPKYLIKSIDVFNSLSFSAVANNVLTFTNYSGYTPDLGRGNPLQAGWDTLRYPNRLEIMLGVKATF